MKRRNRSASQRYQLISAANLLGGCHVIRRIGDAEGEQLVAQRKAVRIEDAAGQVAGYQLCRLPELPRHDEPKPSSPSITRGEFAAFIGFFGRSRTAKLSEVQRKERVLNGLLPEDWIERAQGKVASYAVTH